MTLEEQNIISSEILDIHCAIDTAADLLWEILKDFFTSNEAGKGFAYDYKHIQTRLTAVSEFLYKACLKMDFISGEETLLTESYKRNVEELISCHSIKSFLTS